jgi:hypothetical protein
MRQSGMTGLIEKRIHDARKAGKIRYRLSDLIVRIILHILDGDWRLSCFARNPHLFLFREIFCGNEPHPTATVNALKTNKLLTNMLGKILLRSALKTLKSDLYPGSAHSKTNVKRAFRLILKARIFTHCTAVTQSQKLSSKS